MRRGDGLSDRAPRKKRDELVAAESRHGGFAGQREREPVRELAQQSIPGAVPERVVEVLEVVEVDEQQAQLRGVWRLEMPVDRCVELPAVGESREFVGVRLHAVVLEPADVAESERPAQHDRADRADQQELGGRSISATASYVSSATPTTAAAPIRGSGLRRR